MGCGAGAEIRRKPQAGAGRQELGPRQRGRSELGFAGDVGGSVSSYVLMGTRPCKFVVKITGDTSRTTSVLRFLVPQPSLVSGPGSGTGQEQRRTHRGLQISSLHRRESASPISVHLLLPHWRAQPAKLHASHFEFSYFRKFDTKWQMNANYTSIAQLKLEMSSTGSFGNPGHSSRSVSGPRGARANRQPHCLLYTHIHTHTRTQRPSCPVQWEPL